MPAQATWDDAGRPVGHDLGGEVSIRGDGDVREMRRYVGRFAPSPTGPLHAGSLVAALASWLDARAHAGQWLVRIEDVDIPRTVPGADQEILRQLAACGLLPDTPVTWQTHHADRYSQALQRLRDHGWAYDCGCSRSDIAHAVAAAGSERRRHQALIYPGTCRPARGGLKGKPARAVRILTVDPATGRALNIDWTGLSLTGAQPASGPSEAAYVVAKQAHRENLAESVGDFVLRRADGLWAYQLAVVVDDGWQGISHVVRGEDLADNTARQIHVQHLLGLPTPVYLHTPLVLDGRGEKLSKQTGALPVNLADPGRAVLDAAQVLGLRLDLGSERKLPDLLAQAVTAWRAMRQTRD